MMMMEEQYSRNNNTVSAVVVDRISGLPDCILGVILSFLRTKEAVATSVLSKRWKSAWLDVHNLDLSSHDFVKSPDYVAVDPVVIISFISFVHRALLLIDGRQQLNQFRLTWHTFVDSSHVISWVDAAIQRKVCEITLYLGEGALFETPITGFNSHSLRSLQIETIFFVSNTTAVCLPRLETLKLNYCRFESVADFEKLIIGCPMLHYLELHVYFDDEDDPDEEEDFVYTVSSSSLRHLHMYLGVTCTLKLNAPSLEHLSLRGRISEFFVEKSLTSLVEAHFDTELSKDDSPCNVIVEVVRALDHAKSLTLSATVMRALGLATTRLSTEFKSLTKLVAKAYCCSVQDIIQNSEILEELIIDKVERWDPITIYSFDHSRWTAPLVVPRCFSKTLKSVRFNGYKGLEDEREMIRYMLEHGTALEVMQIRCCSDQEPGKRLELVQEICEFPRKSLACQFST